METKSYNLQHTALSDKKTLFISVKIHCNYQHFPFPLKLQAFNIV